MSILEVVGAISVTVLALLGLAVICASLAKAFDD